MTIRGMVIANDLLIGLVESSGYDRLHLVRMDQITQSAPPSLYIGGFHYRSPVLDQKLGLLIRTVQSVERKTLQSQLQLLSRQGIGFIGDSPTRRLYIRAIVHLEKIDDEVLAEEMQNNAKQLATQQRITGDSDVNQFSRDSASGDLHLRYLMTEDLSTDWIEQIESWNVQYLYFGSPFLHILYNPMWKTKMCDPSFHMEDALIAVLRQLEDTAVRLKITILVGAGNVYSAKEDSTNRAVIAQPELLPSPRNESCIVCWHQIRCERFSQTIQGMSEANKMLADVISQFGALRLLHMGQLTQQQPADLYLGGGHFKGPVVDQKLAVLVDAVWSATLQAGMPKPEVTKRVDILSELTFSMGSNTYGLEWNISQLSAVVDQGLAFVGDSATKRLFGACQCPW